MKPSQMWLQHRWLLEAAEYLKVCEKKFTTINWMRFWECSKEQKSSHFHLKTSEINKWTLLLMMADRRAKHETLIHNVVATWHVSWSLFAFWALKIIQPFLQESLSCFLPTDWHRIGLLLRSHITYIIRALCCPPHTSYLMSLLLKAPPPCGHFRSKPSSFFVNWNQTTSLPQNDIPVWGMQQAEAPPPSWGIPCPDQGGWQPYPFVMCTVLQNFIQIGKQDIKIQNMLWL